MFNIQTLFRQLVCSHTYETTRIEFSQPGQAHKALKCRDCDHQTTQPHRV